MTLLEILVVIAIIGILASLFFIIPRDSSAVRAAAVDLSAKVTRARMEALRTNEFVGLQVDRTTNSSFLFTDLNRNAAYDSATESAIGNSSASYGGGSYGSARISATTGGTVANGPITLVFDTRGISRNTTARTITFANGSGNITRTVTISAQGRSSVQ